MNLPNNYKVRAGDVIVVRAKVKFAPDSKDDDIHLEIAGATWATVAVGQEYIVGLVSRNWEAGDKVRVLADGLSGEVIAVHEGLVWTKRGDGSLTTFMATDLEEAE